MSKVIAAYGGGFKPPTKGHLEVVKKALKSLPEIDEFIIYVGSKERNGVSQAEAILIWDIFKKYLPMKVKIEPAESPIGDIIRLGKNNPEDEVYFIIGGREGRDDDLEDIENRTKNIESAYPNMKVKVQITQDKGMSGTNARKAAKVSSDELAPFLPDELDDKEKEDVFNILRPIIKEEITKSQLDSIEKYADGLFNKLGIDIEFTRHFLDRLNDKRNKKPITVAELIGMFKRLYKKHGKPLSKIDDDFDAVVKDFNNNINIPFAINVNDDDIEMYAKTVMRKKDFKTSTPVIALEEGRYDREVTTISRMIINIFKDNFGKDFTSKFEDAGELEDGTYDLETYFYTDGFKTLGPSPFIVNAAGDGDGIAIQINYNPESFPKAYNELIPELKDAIRHELEHTAQSRFNKGVTPDGKDQDNLSLFDYLTLDYEIPAFVQGLYKKAKTKKITLSKAIQDFFDERSEELSYEEENKIKKIWGDWIKNNLNIIKESIEKDVIDSFDIQDTLVKDVWDDLNLKPEIKEKLLKIAQDFFDSLELPEGTVLKDIKLTGSLANFNWSKFSDVDLHLVIDFSQITNNEKFAKDYFDAKKNLWNNAHNINIFGYPVEVYVEDVDEAHTASGLYSILNDEWITIPQNKKIIIDKSDIKSKAEGYLSSIPQLEKMYDEGKYKEVISTIDQLKERIRNMRSSGLEKGGLYSVENLAFKVLRRSDFVEELNTLKTNSYDAMMSLKEKLNENASYTKDINLIDKLSQLTQHMLDKGMNIEPLPNLEFVNGDSENAREFFGKTAYYDPNTQTIVLYTEGRHPKDIARSYAHEMIHHTQNLEDRLGNITTTNTQEDDELNDIEAEANLKGTMTFRNWTDSLDEKQGFDPKLGKDPFGLNQFAREIAEGVLILEEEVVSSPPMEYKIYSDMDGVLTDFNKSFEKYSKGIPPREYEKKFGKEGFWKLIDGEGKVGFWVGMPWMEDAKQYWDYIKDYDVELLSSPSRSETSRLGKRLWVRNNMPGIKLHLAQAYNKKNYAEPNHILIDDRESNIEQWKEAGGIGILHKNANDTIKQLKALGL